MDKNAVSNEIVETNDGAKETEDAKEIEDAKKIEDAEEIEDSAGIENAEVIEDAENIQNAEGIEDAERIEDTEGIGDSEGIEDFEGNEDAEMLTVQPNLIVPVEPGDQVSDVSDELKVFHTERDLVWDAIIKYINHLSYEEVTETRRLFCGCVNIIIDAYEEKLREVQALKNKVKVWKKISHRQGQKIEELESKVTELTQQLASKVCEDCAEKRLTEQISSLSMQENTTKKPKSKSEVDGGPSESNIDMNILRKRPHEDDESDFLSDEEELTSQFVYKCQYAACGLTALLNMIYKMKINFCPSKLIQMIGKVGKNKNPNCTHLLNNIKDKEGPFLKPIHDKNIEEGEQEEALKNAEAIFLNTQQKAGILSYTTDAYKHCVNIYRRKSGKWKIYDANSGKKYIEDLHLVCYLEVVVLVCDEEDGVPHISKRWSKCHARHCEVEVKKLNSQKKKGEVSHD